MNYLKQTIGADLLEESFGSTVGVVFLAGIESGKLGEEVHYHSDDEIAMHIGRRDSESVNAYHGSWMWRFEIANDRVDEVDHA
jgi:hypothetical protein